MKRKLVLGLLTGLLAINLTGCMDVNMHMKVNSDGSGTFGYKIVASKSALKSLGSNESSIDKSFEKMQQEAKKEKYKVEKIDKGDNIGVSVEKGYDDMIKSNPFSDLPNSDNQSVQLENKKILTRDKGFFYDKYKFKVKINQKNEYSNVPGVTMTFTLDTPSKPDSQNATSVDGNSLTWNMLKVSNMSAEFKAFHWVTITLSALAGVVVILGLIILVVKKKKPAEGVKEQTDALEEDKQ